jgi:hypothetical protein
LPVCRLRGPLTATAFEHGICFINLLHI